MPIKLALAYLLGLTIIQNVASFERDYLLDVKTLTFRKGALTIGYKPVEQLQCKNLRDSVCSKFEISVATCENIGLVKGSDNVGWKCSAQFPENIKFDALNVQCERFPGESQGMYVIRGSCALRYSLLDTSGSSVGLIIFGVIAGIIILALLVTCCIKSNSATVYHDHAPVSVVSTTPNCGVYTVPVAVPYYSNHHHHTGSHFSGNNSGYAGTSYTGGGGYTSSSAFGGTDYR